MFSAMFSFIVGGGDSSNKRQTKEEKGIIQQAKQEKIEERIQQVQNIEKVIYDNVISDSSNISLDEFKSIMVVTETAKNQLQRGSAPLNKTDLAMVALALDPTQDLAMLQKLTISDLNALIRTIIYCPKVSKKSEQPLLENNKKMPEHALVPKSTPPVKKSSNSQALTTVSNKSQASKPEQIIKSSKNPFSSV